MEYSIDGRSTRMGAFTDATVIGPDKEIPPNYEEQSKTGRHWTKEWDDISGCLVLVEDYTNSRKNHCAVPHKPDVLTPIQEEALRQFKLQHRIKE